MVDGDVSVSSGEVFELPCPGCKKMQDVWGEACTDCGADLMPRRSKSYFVFVMVSGLVFLGGAVALWWSGWSPLNTTNRWGFVFWLVVDLVILGLGIYWLYYGIIHLKRGETKEERLKHRLSKLEMFSGIPDAEKQQQLLAGYSALLVSKPGDTIFQGKKAEALLKLERNEEFVEFLDRLSEDETSRGIINGYAEKKADILLTMGRTDEYLKFLDYILEDKSLINSEQWKTKKAEALVTTGRKEELKVYATGLLAEGSSSNARVINGVISKLLETEDYDTGIYIKSLEFQNSRNIDTKVMSCMQVAEFQRRKGSLVEAENTLAEGSAVLDMYSKGKADVRKDEDDVAFMAGSEMMTAGGGSMNKDAYKAGKVHYLGQGIQSKFIEVRTERLQTLQKVAQEYENNGDNQAALKQLDIIDELAKEVNTPAGYKLSKSLRPITDEIEQVRNRLAQGGRA